MHIDPPHYREFYPNMSKVAWSWKSYSSSDMGWMIGLHSIAKSSLRTIFGEFDAFQLDPLQPLNFSGLDYDHVLKDSHGMIVYLSFWLVALLVFLICGYCWCICNRCCCCVCIPAGDEQRECFELIGGLDKMKRFSVTGIIFAVIMGVWLIILVTLIRHTFSTSEKTNEVIQGVYKDMNSSIKDLDLYLDTTRRQIRYTFQLCFWALRDRIKHILKQCTGVGCKFVMAKLTEMVQNALDTTSEYVIRHSTELDMALSNVQAEIVKAENQMKNQFEDKMVEVESLLHGFFLGFNILYCLAVFAPILVSTIFLTFGRGKCLRTVGLLLLRGAIVFMFLLGIAAILQLVIMFLASGITSEIICPAIRRLENGNQNVTKSGNSTGNHTIQKRFVPPGSDLMKVNEYKVPEYGAILRGCRSDQSAYQAFNLKNAYDVQKIIDFTDTYFNIDITSITFNLMKHSPVPIPLLVDVIDKLPPKELEKVKHALEAKLQNNIAKPSALNPLLAKINPTGHIVSVEDAIKTLRKMMKRSSETKTLQNTEVPLPTVVLNPVETVDEIKSQIKNYTHFVVQAIEQDLGRCKPAYMAINTTVNLFCEKIVAPVMSFWWILQFMPPTLMLMIITALLIDKLN